MLPEIKEGLEISNHFNSVILSQKSSIDIDENFVRLEEAKQYNDWCTKAIISVDNKDIILPFYKIAVKNLSRPPVEVKILPAILTGNKSDYKEDHSIGIYILGKIDDLPLFERITAESNVFRPNSLSLNIFLGTPHNKESINLISGNLESINSVKLDCGLTFRRYMSVQEVKESAIISLMLTTKNISVEKI